MLVVYRQTGSEPCRADSLNSPIVIASQAFKLSSPVTESTCTSDGTMPPASHAESDYKIVEWRATDCRLNTAIAAVSMIELVRTYSHCADRRLSGTRHRTLRTGH